ncbi:hypothetical protein COOONC_13737 [Cooperia oncophora]
MAVQLISSALILLVSAEDEHEYRLDRFRPYPRREAFRGRRLRDTYRPSKQHSDDERRKSSRSRSSRERSPRRHTRNSSHERTHQNKADIDDKDIPFEELEEVDCYDEVGDGDSEFTDGASGTGESNSGEDDDLDDVSMLPSAHGASNGDDDFPDLCEEIDVDAMRRAAAAATNAVLFDENPHESPVIISSPPKPGTTKSVDVSNRAAVEKNGKSSGSCRTTVNGDRRDGRFKCSSNSYRGIMKHDVIIATRTDMNVDRHDIREYIGVDPEIETIGIVSNVLPREKLDRLRRDTRTTTRNALHQEKLGRPRRDTRVHHEKRASSREARPSASGHSGHHEKRASSREARPSTSGHSGSP